MYCLHCKELMKIEHRSDTVITFKCRGCGRVESQFCAQKEKLDGEREKDKDCQTDISS